MTDFHNHQPCFNHRNIKIQGIATVIFYCTGRVENVTLFPFGYRR